LYATLCKPGVQIAGPVPAGNPGVYVSTIAQLNLTVVCFMAKALCPYQSHFVTSKEVEKDYKEPDDAHKFQNQRRSLILLQNCLKIWLNTMARTRNHYVICKIIAVHAEATDPTFGEPWSVYSSLNDEIAAWADHGVHQDCIDNACDFELLNEAIHKHKHVKM
jgi:hypothetical protein